MAPGGITFETAHFKLTNVKTSKSLSKKIIIIFLNTTIIQEYVNLMGGRDSD